MQPRMTFALSEARAHAGFWSTWCLLEPPGLFYQTAIQLGTPQQTLIYGVVPLQVQNFAFLLADLHEVPMSLFPHTVKVAVCRSTTLMYLPILLFLWSHQTLLELHSSPSPGLMKMLNRIGSSTDPWGTLLVTVLQLAFIPLIITLRTQPFIQFSIYLTVSSSSPYISSLSIEDLIVNIVKGFQIIKLVKHDFPMVNPCWQLWMIFSSGFQG